MTTCMAVQERLDEYADGTLPQAELHDLELHLEQCAGCREQERLLRALLANVGALPESIEPARDLWPELVERLRSRPRRVLGLAGSGVWWGAGLAAAATVVLALWATLPGRGPEAPAGATTAGTGAGAAVSVATGATKEPLLDVDRQYAQASEELQKALAARRATLPPETRASVERNLAAIDAALAEIRLALQQQPENPGLNRLLAATHQRKVEVLRQVVRLSL